MNEKIKNKQSRKSDDLIGKLIGLMQESQEIYPQIKFNFMIKKSEKDPKVFIHNISHDNEEGDIIIQDETNEHHGKGILRLIEKQSKKLLQEQGNEASSFDLIFLFFNLYNKIIIELLRQTNELNVIEMDERVMALIQSQSYLILKNLKRSLLSHLEQEILRLKEEYDKFKKQEHVYSFHLKGELEAHTKIYNQLYNANLPEKNDMLSMCWL